MEGGGALHCNALGQLTVVYWGWCTAIYWECNTVLCVLWLCFSITILLCIDNWVNCAVLNWAPCYLYCNALFTVYIELEELLYFTEQQMSVEYTEIYCNRILSAISRVPGSWIQCDVASVVRGRAPSSLRQLDLPSSFGGISLEGRSAARVPNFLPLKTTTAANNKIYKQW